MLGGTAIAAVGVQIARQCFQAGFGSLALNYTALICYPAGMADLG